MYVVYTQLLRKTGKDSVTAGLRNGILIKNGVRQYVVYVVIDCVGSIIRWGWVVAGYPMVEVFFVWCVMRDGRWQRSKKIRCRCYRFDTHNISANGWNNAAARCRRVLN